MEGIIMAIERNEALEAESKYQSAVESVNEYVENFDILETITNVGNDEVFTPRKTCDMILDSLPDEVWHNPNYKWLNPATKNGIFEREIAIGLDQGLKDIIPDREKRRKHILQNMIYAIGQTKFTANVARRTVYYCSQANRKCDGIKADDGHYVNGYAIGNGTWFDDDEGNIKTPCTVHSFVKGRCKFCGISEDSKYNDVRQREKYAYEFIHIEQDKILTYLQDRFFGGNRNMKFDIVIGNPPYQLSDGGAQASSRPIYQLFVQQAIALKPKYISMIMPSRWMAGGKGLDDFRESFISDKHILKLNDFTNSKVCFPNNDIKGGVCFFLWDREYKGKCQIIKSDNGKISKSARYLKEGNVDIFIRDDRLVEILKKVVA
jgi:site-specific DNA-methyltransferase (adenine-specific)